MRGPIIVLVRTASAGAGPSPAASRRPGRSLVLVHLLVSLVCLAFAPGCEYEKQLTAPAVSVYQEQSSPERILTNLKLAYTAQFHTQYARLFSQDFLFVFSIPDVVGEDPTPVQWPRTAEVDAARHLFADETVEEVTLDWSPGAPEPAAGTFPAFPECQQVRVEDVNLRVVTRPPDLDEPLIYLVEGATHLFFFKEGRGDEAYTYPGTGNRRWYCFEWEDSPISGKTEELSWGRVKFLFQ